MIYDHVVKAVREMMNRIAMRGRPLTHTVFESVEGGQKGFLIYRAHHGAVTTPIMVWVDRLNEEVALGLVYLIPGNGTLCESVLISDPDDLNKVELKLTPSVSL